MNGSSRFNLPFVPQFGRYYFGLTKNELGFLLLLSLLTVVFFILSFESPSNWMVVGLVFSGFVLVHIALTNSRYIVVPGFASLIACIQWIISPWLSYLYPPQYPGLRFAEMAVPAENYFSYVVPATMALWVGLHFPLWNIRKDRVVNWSNACWQIAPLNGRQKLFIDIVICFGLMLSFSSSYLPKELDFFYYSLANLRFVGILYWMITRTKGWMWRTGLVFSILLVQLTVGGVFYQLILWLIYLFIALAYIKKWSWKILPIFITSIILLVWFNNVKTAYRLETSAIGIRNKESAISLGRLFLDAIRSKKGLPEIIEKRSFGDMLVRYNQGWIISRIISWVPNREPYASGETVSAAFVDSLVPRFLFPNKFSLSSDEIFKKYTGHNPDKASMALSISGEMYANFGRDGGIIATFFYALLIGCIFFGFVHLARDHVLWLAWVPFVLLAAFEAEWNLVNVLNSIIKSLLVMALVVCFSPFFRKGLFKNRNAITAEPSNATAKFYR